MNNNDLPARDERDPTQFRVDWAGRGCRRRRRGNAVLDDPVRQRTHEDEV